jgi:hypothetical protein
MTTGRINQVASRTRSAGREAQHWFSTLAATVPDSESTVMRPYTARILRPKLLRLSEAARITLTHMGAHQSVAPRVRDSRTAMSHTPNCRCVEDNTEYSTAIAVRYR